MTNKYHFKEFNPETNTLIVTDTVTWGKEYQIKKGTLIVTTWNNKRFEVLNITQNSSTKEIEIEISDNGRILINLEEIAWIVEEDVTKMIKTDKLTDFSELLKNRNSNKQEVNIETPKTPNIEVNNKQDSKIITVNDKFLSALTNRLPKKNLFIELIESKLQLLKSIHKSENEYNLKLEEILIMIYDELYN